MLRSSLLDPFSAVEPRRKQVKDAKDLQHLINDLATRTDTSPPPYDFLELIGKGSFGRVYKCKSKSTHEVVAVKIIDVDEGDYRDKHNADDTIADFIKETGTLKRLKDSNARNINKIFDAFDWHSQLWLVSEYCPGGSVHTLMKATPQPGLEEEYIIPIARELAIALKSVHDAGIIHRDVKCANILISEQGALQLCDFGVAAVMESDVSKRHTFIGTPYWMAPEMHFDQPFEPKGYGMEIDCWAYGCTVFEMATGFPPNHLFSPEMLRKVLRTAPRLEPGKYSEELCEFVAFCLHESPEQRPTAKQIMEHPFIAHTSSEFPTATATQLIDRYIQWERKGGQRMSLFNPAGAAAIQLSEQPADGKDDWIFSTTDGFDQDFDRRYSQIGIETTDFARAATGTLPSEVDLPAGPVKQLTPFEEAVEDNKAKRGERSMQRLFDTEAEPYDRDNVPEGEEQPLSDLPLRNIPSGHAANRETLIDLDFGAPGINTAPTFNFDFSEMPTVKAGRPNRISIQLDADDEEYPYYDTSDQDTKRATKEWKFPSLTVPAPGVAENPNRRTMDWSFDTAGHIQIPEAEPEFVFPSTSESPLRAPAFRPTLTRTATEPVGQQADFLHPPHLSLPQSHAPRMRDSAPMIDLDLDLGESFSPNFEVGSVDTVRPATAMSRATSTTSLETSGNPFDLEEDPSTREADFKRFSKPKQHRSESSRFVDAERARRARRSRERSHGPNRRSGHERDSSIDSTASSGSEARQHRPGYNREYSRSMGEHMRGQLQTDLQATATMQPPSWARMNGIDSFDDTDTDAAPNNLAHGPDFNGADYAHDALNEYRGAVSDGAGGGSGNLGDLAVRRTRARALTQSTTDSFDSDGSTFRPHRNGMIFPAIAAPAPAAMMEGADPEIMYQELDRLMKDMENGLAVAADVLRRREEELDVNGAHSDGDASLAGPVGGDGNSYD